jgi:hypothetical protein
MIEKLKPNVVLGQYSTIEMAKKINEIIDHLNTTQEIGRLFKRQEEGMDIMMSVMFDIMEYGPYFDELRSRWDKWKGNLIKEELHVTTVSMMAAEIAVWRNQGKPTYEQVKEVMDEYYQKASESLKEHVNGI